MPTLGGKSGARPATALQGHVELHQNKGTHEDDTNAPHVRLAWIIATACENLGCQIWVAAHYARCLDQTTMCVWRGGVWLSAHVSHHGAIRILDDARSIGDRTAHGGAGVCKNDRGTKVDEFDDVTAGEDAVVEFEIPMGETQRVEIGHTVAYLTEDTKYLWTKHFGGHDDREEVVRGIFHDLSRVKRCRAGYGERHTS